MRQIPLPFNRVLLYAASCVYPNFPQDFSIVDYRDDDYDIDELVLVDESEYLTVRTLVEEFLTDRGYDIRDYNFIKIYSYNEQIDYLSAVQIYR